MTTLPETFPAEPTDVFMPPVVESLAPWEPAAVEPLAPSESPPFEAAELPQAPAVQAALVAAVEAPSPPPAERPAEMQTSLLAMLENSIEETRARYAVAHSAAQDAAAAAEASYGAAQSGVAVLQAKTIEAIQAGAHAHFDLMTTMAGARTLSELLTAQTEFTRKQFEANSAHVKQLAELAREIAEKATAPLQAHVAKTFKI